MEKKEPEFLFLKRKEGWLDITKGHIEEGEDGITAALRETKEESGLDMSGSIDKYFACTIRYKVRSGSAESAKELNAFIAEASPKAQIKMSKEHMGSVWLKYSEAMKEIKKGWQRDLLPRAYDYIKRKAEMSKLNAEYSKLPTKLKPWNLSDSFVPGEGPLDAKVMLVGQAPGAQEDAEGRPFIGRSGKLLDQLIRLSGMDRKDVYITSVVQFFPPANRMPTDSEILACRKFLYRQMKIIRPRLAVLLGAVAAKEVLGIKGISAVHGRTIDKDGIRYLLSLHPAAAVRIKSNLPKIESDFNELRRHIAGMGIAGSKIIDGSVYY